MGALRNFDVSYNRLAGPLPFANLPNMRELRIERNLFTTLSRTLVAPKLRRLVAHDNYLFGFLPLLQASPFLEVVQLQNNLLAGSIPGTWSNLVRLEYLDVSGNQLTGVVPSGVTLLPDLKTLRVNGNSLTNITCPTGKEEGTQSTDWWADCGIPPGSDENNVEIPCPCCSHCCVDRGGCSLQSNR